MPKHTEQGLFGPIELETKEPSPSWKRRYTDYGGGWKELAEACLLFANHVCQDCHKNSATNAHHIIPLSKGGLNELSNLKAVCFNCHKRYHPHLGRRKGDKGK